MPEPDFDSFDAPQVTVQVERNVADRTYGFLVSKLRRIDGEEGWEDERKPWFKLKVAAELIDEIMGKPRALPVEPEGEVLRAEVVIGAVRWKVQVTLGDEQAQIFRMGQPYSEATWEVLTDHCTIVPCKRHAASIPPLVLRQLERELWTVMQERI